MWPDLLDTLALLCSALALGAFGTALWWVPRGEALWRPVRWLLWLGLVQMAFLLSLDLLVDALLFPAVGLGQDLRRFGVRLLFTVQAVGFLVLAWYTLQAVRAPPPPPTAPKGPPWYQP